jgi:DNA mismatch repair protein MutS
MSDDENAWLVYGMNASGKSTLMKAIGLAVILAQAGSYVPAESMELIPFTAVYTRILNNDNLFAGLSSFAVEMSELRDILRSADNNSLVLGDELCAGTESVSAQALVAAGMKWLSKKKSKFVFATHLHELPQLLNLEEIGLKVWHLHVDYNPHTKKLVYDRSLRPGSGSTLYGLEVARAMDLPSDFITDAHEFRNRLTGTKNIQDAPHSAWNSQITRHKCEICGNAFQRDLEVHHIRERASAKKGDKSVHNVSNLVVLCESCHDKHHVGELEIGGIISTSDGPQRIIQSGVNINDNDSNTLSVATTPTPTTTTATMPTPTTTTATITTTKSAKSKWTSEQLDIIEQYIKSNPNMSAKTLSFKLENEKEIIISASHLGKLRAQYYE